MSKAKGTIIYLYSLNLKLLNTFTSSRIAAKHLICNKNTILKYVQSSKVFKDQYILLLKELSSIPLDTSSNSSLS